MDLGFIDIIASVNSLRLSEQAIRISSTPLVLRSVSTLSRSDTLSIFVNPHSKKLFHAFFVKVDYQENGFADYFSVRAYFYVNANHPDHKMSWFQWSNLPFIIMIQQPIRYIR